MSEDWLSLALEQPEQPLSATVTAATPPARSTSSVRPSGVDHEDDLTAQPVPISKEFAPQAVMRYREQGRNGDPRNLFALYREMPGRASGPQIRRSRLAIEGATWEFAPMPLSARDETIRTPEAALGREVAAYLTEVLRPHMRTALRLWAKKEHFGFAGAKFSVEPGAGPDGLERVNEFKEILGDRFRLDWSSQEWRLYPRRNSGETVPCRPLIDTGSLLLFEDSPGYPLDQRGLLWTIIVPWCVYQFGLRWWARLNERFALPYLDVAYDDTVEKGAEKAERIALSMGSSGYSVRPKDKIIPTFLNSMQQAQPDSLERAQEFCLRAFSAALLGHDQATGAREGAGAKTSDVAAQGVAEWLVAQQLTDASADFEAKWYGPMVRRNFGDRVAAKHTPVLVLQPTQKADREAEARIANLAVNAGAEIPQSEFLKRIGYREPRGDEKVLSRRTLAAPAPAKKGAEQLGENVVRFPQLGEGGRPPVLGADGAPEGIAEEILAPYRRIFLDAKAEGATPVQALARVAQRARTRPEGKVIADRISSVLFASTGHGLEEIRDERSGR